MELEIIFVNYIPDDLESGRLYISRMWQTSAHLCPCGCGEESWTSLKEGGWTLTETDGKVSLSPSIGNTFRCKSHYWIIDNAVKWA